MADIGLFASSGDKGITAEVHHLDIYDNTHVLSIKCDGAEVRFFLNEEQIGYLFGTLNNYLDKLDKVAHA